jgi:hypothetical protein
MFYHITLGASIMSNDTMKKSRTKSLDKNISKPNGLHSSDISEESHLTEKSYHAWKYHLPTGFWKVNFNKLLLISNIYFRKQVGFLRIPALGL